MTGQRWRKLQDLFEAALELPASERADYLAQECGDDTDLLSEVHDLLASAESGRVEETLRQAATEVLEVSPQSGNTIGPYRLLHELGSGGMGRVYLAERADGEFEQRVAIKVVRAGALNPRIAERFRSEKQILARLDHPNIARLIDGGTTEDGVPYFVMEYVDGDSIDRYCDRLRLSTRGRLELFQRVCDAVDSAHRNLVVHRDLKPSNILVTEDGVPKLLDFGIAKLLEPDDRAERPAVTRIGDRAMTPEYASPEQVRAQPVSTATDVYTLGLLLYEILTGHRAHRLTSYTPGEVERVVCDEAPERPSTVVTRPTSADGSDDASVTPEEVCEARSTEPWKLRRRLAGELDNIVMMALRKEPERRYRSAASLAADIGRHLAGLPVEAHADSSLYRARKFVSRNRVAVAVALMGLLTAMILTAFYTRRLASERDLAQRESEKATRVAQFLQSVFAISDPDQRRGEEVTARELLDRGAREIRADATLPPGTRAELLGLLGEVHGKLGLYDTADELLGEALGMLSSEYGARSAEAAAAAFSQAAMLREKGAPGEAYDQLQGSLEIRSELFGKRSAESAEVLSILGMAKVEQGETEQGTAMIQDAVDILEASATADPTSLAAAVHYLGNLAWTRGDFAEAERTYQRVLEIRERYLGPEHTEVGDSLQSLAVALILQNREREALPYYARAREIFERRLGAEHPRVARVLEGVAAVHARTGELEAAEVAYRHSLAIHGAATGADGLNAGIAMGNVGRVVAMQGRFGEAIEIGERSVEIVARHTSPRTSAWVEGTLAESYRLAGRFDHAADAFERSLALREQVLPPGHPGLAEALTGLAEARIGQGRPEEARDLLERAVELLESQGDDERADLVAARARLTEVRAQLAERGKTARP